MRPKKPSAPSEPPSAYRAKELAPGQPAGAPPSSLESTYDATSATVAARPPTWASMCDSTCSTPTTTVRATVPLLASISESTSRLANATTSTEPPAQAVPTSVGAGVEGTTASHWDGILVVKQGLCELRAQPRAQANVIAQLTEGSKMFVRRNQYVDLSGLLGLIEDSDDWLSVFAWRPNGVEEVWPQPVSAGQLGSVWVKMSEAIEACTKEDSLNFVLQLMRSLEQSVSTAQKEAMEAARELAADDKSTQLFPIEESRRLVIHTAVEIDRYLNKKQHAISLFNRLNDYCKKFECGDAAVKRLFANITSEIVLLSLGDEQARKFTTPGYSWDEQAQARKHEGAETYHKFGDGPAGPRTLIELMDQLEDHIRRHRCPIGSSRSDIKNSKDLCQMVAKLVSHDEVEAERLLQQVQVEMNLFAPKKKVFTAKGLAIMMHKYIPLTPPNNDFTALFTDIVSGIVCLASEVSRSREDPSNAQASMKVVTEINNFGKDLENYLSPPLLKNGKGRDESASKNRIRDLLRDTPHRTKTASRVSFQPAQVQECPSM